MAWLHVDNDQDRRVRSATHDYFTCSAALVHTRLTHAAQAMPINTSTNPHGICRHRAWCSGSDAVCASHASTARSHHASARLGGEVYFAGGKVLDGDQWRLIPEADMLEVLDTATGSIQAVQRAAEDCQWPMPRAGASMAVMQDRLLVMFGGQVRPWMLDHAPTHVPADDSSS